MTDIDSIRLNHDDIVYKVRGKSYPGVPTEFLRVEDANLDEYIEEHGARFAWYGTLHALAVSDEARAKQELEIVYAQIDKAIRNEAKANDVKLTEKMVENSVKTNADYCRYQDVYNEKAEAALLLKSAVDSLRITKDMIIQKAYNKRAEIAGDPSQRASMMRGE